MEDQTDRPDSPPNSPQESDWTYSHTPVNPYWKSVVVASFVFCGTTLAIVMTQFGDPQSPGNKFLRQHGALMAAIEVGVVLITGVLAMAVDQRQTRQTAQPFPPNSPPTTPATEEPPHVG